MRRPLTASEAKIISFDTSAPPLAELSEVEISRNSTLRETPAIFVRDEEGAHHLRLDEVAVEVVEFFQPEIVTVEAVIRRIVRVTAQVAEVLHQDERAVELLFYECLVLSHPSQRSGARF